jgi:1-aminocyclopropane-1-carboxylate deaminase/D-cysteine desulfhydrase-like pyridoxal-dependent ACC family enzyme
VQDALAARFPAIAAKLPRIRLAQLQTPIVQAPSFARELGLAELWVKRDDLTSPIYGGNKVRKLEYLLAEAKARDCDAVVTCGGAGSNHALATAIYARRLGLQCYAVLVDQTATPNVEPTLRYHLRLGTHLVHAADYADSRRQLEAILAKHQEGRDRVYEIPWGGSSSLGTVGYVAAALELAEQLREQGQAAPEFIYLAAGSLGTFVGLTLGLRLAGLPSHVVAARVVPGGVGSVNHCATLYAETNRKLHELDASVPLLPSPLPDLELRPEFLGAGYAETTLAATAAVAMAKEFAGWRLETTYTGKALAALIADARAGRLAQRRVLFWNTYNSAPYPSDLAEAPLDRLPAEFLRYVGSV